MRTVLAVVVIAAVGAAAVYVFQRPTLARGEMFAAQFMEHHPNVREMVCDQTYEIGVQGGAFRCAIVMKDGDRERVAVSLDRVGMYRLSEIDSVHPEHHHVPSSADPWE